MGKTTFTTTNGKTFVVETRIWNPTANEWYSLLPNSGNFDFHDWEEDAVMQYVRKLTKEFGRDNKERRWEKNLKELHEQDPLIADIAKSYHDWSEYKLEWAVLLDGKVVKE